MRRNIGPAVAGPAGPAATALHYDTRLYVWATFWLRQYRPNFIQIYMMGSVMTHIYNAIQFLSTAEAQPRLLISTRIEKHSIFSSNKLLSRIFSEMLHNQYSCDAVNGILIQVWAVLIQHWHVSDRQKADRLTCQ